MRRSWDMIRAEAADFARKWQGVGYEKGETQLFYNDFFKLFRVPVRKVASFEVYVKKIGNESGYIDLFWPGTLLVEQKSMGRSLKEAEIQAYEYLHKLKESEYPRYILLSDFQNFELHDLEYREKFIFELKDIPDNIEHFGFIIGVEKRKFRDQDDVNIEASELIGKLYDALAADGYNGHDLERFLVRLVFCLFADNTGIFQPKDIFLDYLEQTEEGGSDVGMRIAKVFETLNLPEDKRPKRLDDSLAQFPHVNGDLFKEPLHRTPDFDGDMRQRLLEACSFNWSKISPAIFGSLFQSVMDPKKRRATGAHYTTEKNIMKVIEPLFLDNLRSELNQARALKTPKFRKRRLRALHDRLASLNFFDPACGSGNFLIIAYREIRRIEIEILREIHAENMDRFKGLSEIPVHTLTKIDVDQFYGLEIGAFAARIAETAMWMMDHIMNNMLSLEFGQAFARIPLRKSPHIHSKDALESDWEKVLPASQCSYVLGNPPFSGSKAQTANQRAQVQEIAGQNGNGGTLDYVAAWFILAGRYVAKGGASIGFVATNSITQGEQVAQLWPILHNRCGLEISFAHRTFAWGSDARGKAHVHVVIVGLDVAQNTPKDKKLFTYRDINGDPDVSSHSTISPYLVDASGLSDPHIVVRESREALNGFPDLLIGSKPIDGGYFILDREERDQLLVDEPEADDYLFRYYGAEDFVNDNERWIIDLNDAEPGDLRSMKEVRKIVELVGSYRKGDIPAKGTQKMTKPTGSAREMANTPTLYHVHRRPAEPFLAVPETNSENRSYLPIGWLNPPVVPSNSIRFILGEDCALFGLLVSRMHMAWLKRVGGQLKSSYRYGIRMVYNTFPVPEKSYRTARIEKLANDVLAAREAHPNNSLADLYDPVFMPADLQKAHRSLDRAVDRLYREVPFSDDAERGDFLLELYESRMEPLIVRPKPRRRRR